MKELGITKGENMKTKVTKKERTQNGYYWVKPKHGYYKDKWVIATYESKMFWVHGIGIAYTDDSLDIDEAEIKQGFPSELLRQRDELREALIDMVWQFAYRGTYEGRENLHTGGLSALEGAFSALGLSDPITVLDFEAAIKNTER